MSGGARQKDQADFDLERFIDMFDEALTSNDERVINALRSLMMMTILTKSESPPLNPLADRNEGPLRRMYEDLNNINRRLYTVEEQFGELKYKESRLPVAVAAEQAMAIEQKIRLDAGRIEKSKNLFLSKINQGK